MCSENAYNPEVRVFGEREADGFLASGTTGFGYGEVTDPGCTASCTTGFGYG
jgi:hypothetical protein